MSIDADRVGHDKDHAFTMDAQYALQRHIYDFTRKYYLLGRDQLITDLAVPPGGSVLEIGVGTGRNLARVARLYPRSKLFGLDVSTEMLKSAQRTMERAGAKDRAILCRADACAFDPQRLFGAATFDRVFISYSLSMIPEWERAFAQAFDVVAPGGSLHVVDFGQQERLPSWSRGLLRAWLREFHVTPRENLFDIARHLAFEARADVRCSALCRGYAWSVVIAR